MKFRYINIISFFFILLTGSSCKKQLAETNINPNTAQTAQNDYLLTAASKITADAYWGADNNFNSSLLIVQHWAKIQYTEPDRYIFSNSSFVSLWNTLYSQSLTDLNTIITQADAEGNTNYKGVALVLRSWAFQLLTDQYGDIPYKQSGAIDQYLTPVYDTQKDVYFGILDDLKAAQAALDPAGKPIAGDVIYGGKIDLWKKFANSLRLRIALRIADREPEKSKQVLADIAAESGAYISDNSEIALLAYYDSPNQNPVSAWFDTRDDYRVSQSMTNRLTLLNDPRLPVFVSKTQTATPTGYVGIPNGLTTGDANNLGFAKTSRPGAYFIAPHAPAVIISYAEVLFDRAEAAARGFTSENAADLYLQAIRASLKQYSIADNDINIYLAQPSIAFNTVNYKQSIGEQKWIALFGQGLEAFAEWRRLDYPQLAPAVAGVLNNQIPVRFIYPGTEQSLNKENYKTAISNQGIDLLTTKLWFDMN